MKPAITNTLAPHTPPGHSGSNDPLLQRKYRNLIRQHFDKSFEKIFAEFTGLHFHVAWTHLHLEEGAAPFPGSACCRLLGSPQSKYCRICEPRRLARTQSSAAEGHRFICPLGLRNYWLLLKLRDQTLGVAYLQALDHSCGQTPVLKRSAHGTQRSVCRGERVLTGEEFARAAKLLRLIIQHVETSSLSDLRKSELTHAGRTVLALKKEQARLQGTLRRHLPTAPQTPRPSGRESHREQVVHYLIESIEQSYSDPITLRGCARELHMNAAYVSAMFSHAVGIPFKTYLTTWRMEKAKELLSDPTMTVSDVSAAVGYNSENRFRVAFKGLLGLCPKLWRETMQTSPVPRESS